MELGVCLVGRSSRRKKRLTNPIPIRAAMVRPNKMADGSGTGMMRFNLNMPVSD